MIVMIKITDVKSKVNIVDVIESYGIKLHGNKARCPFHNDKTPSFSVNVKKQYYKCFGCGESGDAVTFVQKFTGMDLQGALRELNTRFNLGLSDTVPTVSDRILKLKYEEEQAKRRRFEEWKRRAYIALCRYYKELDSILHTGNELTEDRIYAIRNISQTEYMLDILTSGSEEDIIALYKADREKVDKIAGIFGYRC